MNEAHSNVEVLTAVSQAREAINALFNIKKSITRIVPSCSNAQISVADTEKAAVKEECQKMINYLFSIFPTAAPKPE